MKTEYQSQAEQMRRVQAEWRAKLDVENAGLRAERSARRYKAERDPAEYEAQKERQRRQYQAQKGGPVRSYEKIVAGTREERAILAKDRDTARKGRSRAAMSPQERQADTDRKADRQWESRRRAKGVPEAEIQAELIIHVQDRAAERADIKKEAEAEDRMKALPTFGMF